MRFDNLIVNETFQNITETISIQLISKKLTVEMVTEVRPTTS